MATPTRTRDEMREYQRERRARIKMEAWAAVGMAPPPALAKDALRAHAKARAWPAANAIGASPSTDVAPIAPDAARSPAIVETPKSLCSVGGQPGPGLIPCGPGYPLPPDQFAASPFATWQANVETMFATLAAKNDVQERRIAALEKTVNFRESAMNLIAAALARAARIDRA
jgi:hypothetical protein